MDILSGVIGWALGTLGILFVISNIIDIDNFGNEGIADIILIITPVLAWTFFWVWLYRVFAI